MPICAKGTRNRQKAYAIKQHLKARDPFQKMRFGLRSTPRTYPDRLFLLTSWALIAAEISPQAETGGCKEELD